MPQGDVLTGCLQTIRCKQKIRSVAIAPAQSAKGGVSVTIALVNNSLEVSTASLCVAVQWLLIHMP